jgi:hypothetical protein
MFIFHIIEFPTTATTTTTTTTIHMVWVVDYIYKKSLSKIEGGGSWKKEQLYMAYMLYVYPLPSYPHSNFCNQIGQFYETK